jgi:flagellar protein FlbT
MTRSLRLSLKSGERIFINGAVLRPDRKVTLELMNEAVFLLAHHVIQPEQASTPLRQLSFVVQSMLIDPANAPRSNLIFREFVSEIRTIVRNKEILDGLIEVTRYVDESRIFDALKSLRRLLTIEDAMRASTQ